MHENSIQSTPKCFKARQINAMFCARNATLRRCVNISVRFARPQPENPRFHDPQNIYDAVKLLRQSTWAKFDETFEIAVNLGVDPRKANQTVRGVAKLPHGVGKTIRVAVFARDTKADEATAAGADLVGAEDLAEKVAAGVIEFDRCIATPDMMPVLGKLGKILGPRGLMPNPKVGTVTADVTSAVKTAKAGAAQFKVDKGGIIHAGIGKMSYTDQKLLENIRSFMVTLSDSKPEGVKGKYFKACSISSTMGPGIPVDLATVDPGSPRFMLAPISS